MIKNIIAMLAVDNFYGISENIDIAKGKYAVPFTVKKAIQKGIRQATMNNKLKNG